MEPEKRDPRIIEKRCKIRDIVTGTEITFQMMPTISDVKSVNWNMIEIVGRSHPVLGYTSSGPRTFSFTLTFFANPSSSDDTSLKTVSDNLKFLMSLTYPDYDKNLIRPPHKVFLTLGDQIHWSVVAQDISINYSPLWKDNLPVYADVSCTFIEANNYPISFSRVRQ
jgi:hypothetical protein